MTRVNNQIILAERPQGMPDDSTFQFVQKRWQTSGKARFSLRRCMYPSIRICGEEWWMRSLTSNRLKSMK